MTPPYTCDRCKKRAVYNIQDGFTTYEIDKKGEFKEIDWSGNGDNEFLCEDHYNNYYND